MKTFIVQNNIKQEAIKELKIVEKEHNFIPNFYKILTYSENGLEKYGKLSRAKTSLNEIEKLVVGFVVSETNKSHYWVSYLKEKSKKLELTESTIIEFRIGTSSLNKKLNALAKFTKKTITNRGNLNRKTILEFFNNGWSKASIMDINILIGQFMMANFITSVFDAPVDFPWASFINTEEEE